MSIVAFAGGQGSSVTLDVLHDIASKLNIKIRKEDEEAYLLVLQSADATARNVYDFPDFIDPRLAPVPTVGGTRKYWKSPKNSLNAWSHQAKLIAEKPTSSLLKGRTVVMKDNMSVGGLPFTCGTFPQLASSDGKYPIPEIDCTILRRLLEAHATVTGVATCENYSLTPLSYSSANGPVSNPWLPNHNAGGSTSGGACLLGLRLARAAGVPGLEDAGDDVDLVMGGDQAGSIRLPSSFCGIFGLKPSHGLVPYTGISGLHPMIDFTGPMAHNVEDIAVMLSVLAGYDGLDPRMTPESPLRQNVIPYHAELEKFANSADPTKLGKGLRIGIIQESLTSTGTSPAVAEVVRLAAEKHFAAAGATVGNVSVPMHLLGPAIWAAASRTHQASLTVATRVPDMLSHALPHFTPRWPPDQEMYELLTVANPAILHVMFGEELLKEKYSSAVQAKAHRHVFQLQAAYDKALEDFDILITPTTPIVAPPFPDFSPEGASVMEKAKLTVGITGNTCPFNASGHPALSVPCGWGKSSDGSGWLPVGMQIIGKRWDDLGVLKAAKVFVSGGGGLGTWPGLIR